MYEFEQWYNEVCKWCTKYCRSGVLSKKSELYAAWRDSLKWYQSIADKCEQDCNTDEDYKTLYFHLKQVLINEIKE